MTDVLLFAIVLIFVAVVAVFVNKRLLVLLLSGLFVLLVAMRLTIPSMYLMGTVLLALPVASLFVGWYGAQHLQFTLIAPESAFEGEEIPVQVEVVSPLPAFSVLAQPRFQFPDGIRAVDGSETAEAIPGGVRQESLAVTERRGEYDLGIAAIMINDPLGIFTIKKRFSQRHSLIVYPTGLPIPPVPGHGQQIAGWPSGSRLGRRGEDEGFYGTREYRLGDDLRRIHWRSSARHGALVVAERETHLHSTVWICLDAMGGAQTAATAPRAWERCIKAAVTIMEDAIRGSHAVGLIVPGKDETYIAPASSETQRWRILDALARLRTNSDVPLENAVSRLDMSMRSTIVMVTTLPTPNMADAAARLANSSAMVAIVYVEPLKPRSSSGSAAAVLETAAGSGAATITVPGEA